MAVAPGKDIIKRMHSFYYNLREFKSGQTSQKSKNRHVLMSKYLNEINCAIIDCLWFCHLFWKILSSCRFAGFFFLASNAQFP